MKGPSKMTGIAAGIVLAAGCGLAAADPIGQITGLRGEVLLNNGQAVVPAEVGMSVRDHDRLYVLTKSQATLAMAAGCNLELGADQAVTLTNDNQCEPRGADDILTAASATAGSDQALAAIESGAQGQLDERQGALGGALGGGANTAGLATLGVVGAGGVAWAVSDSNSSDNNNPPPPTEPPQSSVGRLPPLSP